MTGGLVTYDGLLLPGESLVASVGTGGVLRMSGAGEIAEVAASRPLWIRIRHPAEAEVVASREQFAPTLDVHLEGALDSYLGG